MSNADKPAFPRSYAERSSATHPKELSAFAQEGMTKREYFAAMAMQGIMANPACTPETMQQFMNIAKDAIRVADELLKQLEKHEYEQRTNSTGKDSKRSSQRKEP